MSGWEELLDRALIAEALFEARIGAPQDTPLLADALLPPLRRLLAAANPPVAGEAGLYIVTREACQDVMAVYAFEDDARQDVEMRMSGGSRGRYRYESWHVPPPLRAAAQPSEPERLDETGIASEGFTGHKPLPNGKCEHRWRNRQTKAVTCRYADGWHAGQTAALVDANPDVRAVIFDLARETLERRDEVAASGWVVAELPLEVEVRAALGAKVHVAGCHRSIDPRAEDGCWGCACWCHAALSGSTAPLDELSVMADALDYSMGPERRRRLAADVLVKLTNAGYRIVRLVASPAQWDRTDPRGEGNPDNFDGSQS